MKYLYLLLAIASSSVLVGCQEHANTSVPQEAVPEPSAKGDAQKATAAEMPVQFQGTWSADCDDEESTSILEIGKNTISYYESSGSIKAAIQRGDLEVATISELAGEGQAWLSLAKFRLTNGNKTLLDVTDESKSAFARSKCEAGQVEESASPDPSAATSAKDSIVSIDQLASQFNEAPYRDMKDALLGLGFTPLKDADRNQFNMSVLGDPAACGMRGCAIPWSGPSVPVFCVGVAVNDNIDEALWLAQIGACD